MLCSLMRVGQVETKPLMAISNPLFVSLVRKSWEWQPFFKLPDIKKLFHWNRLCRVFKFQDMMLKGCF